jgi:16S rRNA (guanine527-N7)-methyltransferase
MDLRRNYINALNIRLSERQIELLKRYAELVCEKNGDFNLTAAQGGQEIWDRHILDGLTLSPLLKPAGISLADCGSGAGFIGICAAIATPKSEITLIESLEKRCAFLNWAVLKLGLKNVKVLNKRIGQEQLSAEHDFVVERAMGKLEDILPLCMGIASRSGRFAAYCSADARIGAGILHKYSVCVENIVDYILPEDGGKKRKMVVLKWI